MRVFLFWNLNKRLFSIRASEGPSKGKVIAHASKIMLSDVLCHVNEGGRQRTIARRCKEVHAGLKANLLGFQGAVTTAGIAAGLASSWNDNDETLSFEAREAGHWLCYDPYKGPKFVHETAQGDRRPIASCDYVYGVEMERKARLFSITGRSWRAGTTCRHAVDELRPPAPR